MAQPFYIIAACEQNSGIGFKNAIPWRLKDEIKHFKEVTTFTTTARHNMVIMGRSTWESLPEKFCPLPDRSNVVLTSNADYVAPGAVVCNSLAEALNLAELHIANRETEKVFVIGGQKVYEEAIHHPDLAGIYLTQIEAGFECDAFFPQIPAEFEKVQKLGEAEENGIKYRFLLYTK